MSFRKWFGLGPGTETEASRRLAIEIARELADTAEGIRRRRCIEALESEMVAVANEGATSRVARDAPREILHACRAALPDAKTLPGTLPTWLPQIVMAGDSIMADLERIADPSQERGMAMAEVYGELMIMLCAGLELCDFVVAEVRSRNPGLTLEAGTPCETELIFRKHMSGKPIALLIKSRQVAAAIDEDMARKARTAP